ncbi:MAG: hypothetical protein KBD50_02520 [Candidatus Pacebacteria bacterium]|nr:hypothetical protein [Candidatus Paceibacterota bacterium]
MNMQLPENDLLPFEWEGRKEGLINRALAAAKRAQSYREFRVGTAVLAYRPHPKPAERFRVFLGANVKADEFARPICAEPPPVLAAYHAGFRRIVGMVVVGNRNLDHASNLNPDTLHSCGECRRVLTYLKNDEGERLVPPEARMHFVRLDSTLEVADPEGADGLPRFIISEEMSFQELCDLHANGNGGHNQ